MSSAFPIYRPPVAPVNDLPRWTPLRVGIIAFFIVNLLDITMTLLLLETGAFHEANPLANYFLLRWGGLGMAAFKLFFVAVNLAIIQVVASRQVRTAEAILAFGFVVIGGVVAYSSYLLYSFLSIH